MIEQLSERIWAEKRFHEESVLLRSTVLRARYLTPGDDAITEAALVRLLNSAVALSASERPERRHAAYEIATAASELESERLPGVPLVLLLVLSRVGNFPALAYARRRYSVNELNLPIRAVVEANKRSLGNTVTLGESSIELTDFQFALWNQLNAGETVGVSAPTSAGKSFILQAYALRLLGERRARNVAFVVPTRALINQVSGELAQSLRGSGVELVTTPVPSDAELPTRAIYVVTQERLQLIQSAHESLSFDLMLVDEAQSLADGPRGVLLSSVVEEALSRNGRMQLLFAGPNIRYSDNVGALFGRRTRNISTDEATVSQNIVFVDCEKDNPRLAKISIRSGANKLALGSIECEEPLIDHKSKLIALTLRLGGGGQNLIYALGPAECEDIAFGLADNDEAPSNDEALRELSNFIKDAVHPKYQLAANVLQKVGFHYGRLPSLVRKAIEDAFANGNLRYLVTTSTLLYGVNLPAQNLFLHTPHRGKDNPISPVDFWNLAGRAGRLGKDFSGNIFLVDYGDWPNDPMSGAKDQDVKPSIEQHVADRTTELIEYIGDAHRVPDRRQQDEMENTFVKLVRDHFSGTIGSTLNKIGLREGDARRDALLAAIANAVEKTNIGPATLLASPTVSLHRQQALYDRLTKSLKKKGPAYIIPRYPLDSGAYTSYAAAIKRCHDEIMKYAKKDKSNTYFAQLALHWMKGEPLPQMIDDAYAYDLKQGRKPNMATVIRETLDVVERDLRFKYVRLFSCYNAVLESVLRDNGYDDLIASIPSIPMYLEVGACSPTMISFMGLGLSRYTAGKLRALPRRSTMSQSEARAWILKQDLESLKIPSASIGEIRRVVLPS